MATITTGVVLLRWQLLSAVLMFLASTLNIRFRKSDYIGLAGITLVDMSTIWQNIETVMVDVMSHTPPDWPMVLN